MPAIQLTRLRLQTAGLAESFANPQAFVRGLHDLLDYYADRTHRPGQSGAPAPLPTSVSLTSEPAGATVLIGDRKLGLTPMDVPIDPAPPPVFTLRLDGYESAQFAAAPKTATPGKPFTIATKLVAAGAAPAPATAAATAAPRPKPKPAPSVGSAAPAPKPKPKPAPKKPSAEVEDPFAE